MEKDELEFLDPRSSLLTIGRVPMMNVLQDYSRHFARQQPPFVHAQRDYQLTCRNTVGFPCSEGEMIVVEGEGGKSSSEFDTSFLDEKSNLNRIPLYIDPLPRSSHFGLCCDSFACSEAFDETDPDPTASVPTPLAERSLVLDQSGGEIRDMTNADGPSLTVPQEDDKVSHSSRPSTAFATPKTGMTPTSSENEGSDSTSRDSTLNRSTKHMEGYSHELTPEESNAMSAQQSNETEIDSNSPTSISTPSFDHLQLPALDRPLEKSDNFSCGTLTGSQGSLLQSENIPKPNSQLHQQQWMQNPVKGIHAGVDFFPKTSTAMSGTTKHVEQFNGDVSTAGQTMHGLSQSSGYAIVSNVSINNADDVGHTRNVIVDSAAILGESSQPVSVSTPTNSELSPQQDKVDKTLGFGSGRTYPPPYTQVDTNGEFNEESHSAGSGSFTNAHLDNLPSTNYHIHSPPYPSYNTHAVFDAHVLPPLPDGTCRPYHSSTSSCSSNIPSEELTVDGRQLPATMPSSLSNGMVPRFEKMGLKLRNRLSQPKKLSLLDREGGSPEHYYSPMNPAGFSVLGQATTGPSNLMGTRSPVHIPPRQHPLSPGLTSIASMTSLLSAMSRSSYKGPSIVEIRGKGRLPLISSVDQVEGAYKFKPGRGIVVFCRDHPNFSHLLYCLLLGRPLIILGKNTDKDMIRRLIRVLWLFIPGHSSRHQVIPWQEKQLDISDLSRVKLVGLSNQGQNSLGAHLKNYVSWWDCTAGKLHTPHYDGELLKPITTRNRDRKTEEVFLTYIHSVLADIAMKAYVYYHGFCASLPHVHRQPMASEASPHAYHRVSRKEKTRVQFLQKLGVKGCDMDIVENLVEVIREQQLAEWNREYNPVIGTLQDDYPQTVTLKLHTRLCTETYCKPKRPY